MNNFSPIRLLPEHLIDQIKAGEVVERPAALIKEILENSIDAGSKHLDLHIVDNGLNLISLVDDGEGMHFEDLPYAFARHATSKIVDYSDLFKLSSYGFRGEALASIASISRLSCTSAKSDGHGGKIEINGSETISHTRVEGRKKGTSLFVRDLFYNTPARLKFVKSKTSEKNALKRTIDAFILTAKHCAFSIQFDDQDKKIYPACTDNNQFLKRVERVFFKRKNSTGSLIYEGSHEFEGHKLVLHISTSSLAGTSGKQQFLFANDRLFNDKRIHQIISKSLPNLWGNDSGHYACFLTTPSDQIDVNVHPNKIEVKFMREDVIFALLKSTLKDLDNLATSSNKNEAMPVTTSANNHWQRFDNQNTQPAHGSSQQSEEKPQYQGSHSVLPPGYRWWASHPHTIVDENALVKLATSQIPYDAQTSFVPLLINEPIFCENRQLDLAKLHDHGFEAEWIDSNLLALRAVASYLRSLPYVDLCRHAIAHIDRNPGELYQDFHLSSHLSDAHFGRLISAHSFESLRSKRIVVTLDSKMLQKVFHL